MQMPKVNNFSKESLFIKNCILGTLTQEIIDGSPSLVNVASIDGFSPLMLTVGLKQSHIIDLLIKNGAKLRHNINGKTALWFAAAEKHWDAVDELLANNAFIDAKPHAKDKDAGKTALWFAASQGEWRRVFDLLERGASIHAASTNVSGDDYGKNILYFAVRDNNLEAVVQLLAKGASEKGCSSDNYYNALLQAAFDAKWDILHKIIEKTSNINVADYSGETALTLAAYYSNWSMVFALLEKGANINVAPSKNTDAGKTVVWYAAEAGAWEVVYALLDKGANMHATPTNPEHKEYGINIFGLAVKQGNLAAIKKLLEKAPTKLLIDYKANINIKNKNGQTLLWYSITSKAFEIATLIANYEQDDINYAPKSGEYDNVTALWAAAIYKQWDIVLLILLKNPNVDLAIVPTDKKYSSSSLQQLAAEAKQEEVLQELQNIVSKKSTSKKLVEEKGQAKNSNGPHELAAASAVCLSEKWKTLLSPYLDVKLIKNAIVNILNEIFTQYNKVDTSKTEKMKFSLKNAKDCPKHLLGFKKVREGIFCIDGKKTASLLLLWDSNPPVNVEWALSELVLLSDEYINFIALQETRKKEQKCRELKQQIFDFEGKFKNLLAQAETQFISSTNTVTENCQLLANKLKIYKLSITDVIALLQELMLDYKKYIQEEQELAPKSELLVKDYNSLDEIVAEIATIKIELIAKLASRIAYVASFLKESFTLEEAKSAVNTLCRDFEDVQTLKNAADILQAKLNEKLTAWKNTSEDYVKKTEKNKIAIKKFQENIKAHEYQARRLEDIKQEAAQMRLEAERKIQSQNDNLYKNALKEVAKLSNQNAKKENKLRVKQVKTPKPGARLSPSSEVLALSLEHYRQKKPRLTNLNILQDIMHLREKTEPQVNIVKEILQYELGQERGYIFTRNYALLVVLASFMESLKQIKNTELFSKDLICSFRNAVYHSNALHFATEAEQENFYSELNSLSNHLLAYLSKPAAAEYATIATHPLVKKLLDARTIESTMAEVNSIIDFEVANLALFYDSYCFHKDKLKPLATARDNFHTIYIKACEYSIARISAGLNWLFHNDATENRTEYTNQLVKLRARKLPEQTVNKLHQALKIYSSLTSQKISLFLGPKIKQQGNDIRHNIIKSPVPETTRIGPITSLASNISVVDTPTPPTAALKTEILPIEISMTPVPPSKPILSPVVSAAPFSSFDACLEKVKSGKVHIIYVDNPSFGLDRVKGVTTVSLGNTLTCPQVISLTQAIIHAAKNHPQGSFEFSIKIYLGAYLGELEEAACDEQTKILFSLNAYLKAKGIKAFVKLFFISTICDYSFEPNELEDILFGHPDKKSELASSTPAMSSINNLLLFSKFSTVLTAPKDNKMPNGFQNVEYIFIEALVNTNERKIQEALDMNWIVLDNKEAIFFLICASNASSSANVESNHYVITAVQNNKVLRFSEYYSSNNELSIINIGDEDKNKIKALFYDLLSLDESVEKREVRL